MAKASEFTLGLSDVRNAVEKATGLSLTDYSIRRATDLGVARIHATFDESPRFHPADLPMFELAAAAIACGIDLDLVPNLGNLSDGSRLVVLNRVQTVKAAAKRIDQAVRGTADGEAAR